MGVQRVEDLRAFQHARAFKCEVYALVRASPDANRDLKYRSQLFESAASVEMNIVEGWRRFGAGEIAQFLRFSRASLQEAEHRLRDGVDRGYFTLQACGPALDHASQCGATTIGLWKSLQPFMKKPKRPGKP
ncbi:MAG TPA: four helix bundle protein [Vicinamibacterales bacterium]|nr:four helix bundle protein [Vicinamibacterales bacterium]